VEEAQDLVKFGLTLSFIFFNCAFSKESVLKWLKNDPYVSAGVWASYTVEPFKTASLDPPK